MSERSVELNLLPLLSHHDRKQFEITCYSAGTQHEERSRKLDSAAEHRCSLADAPDEAVIKQIADDQIDILVDCSTDLAGNRSRVGGILPAFESRSESSVRHVDRRIPSDRPTNR